MEGNELVISIILGILTVVVVFATHWKGKKKHRIREQKEAEEREAREKIAKEKEVKSWGVTHEKPKRERDESCYGCKYWDVYEGDYDIHIHEDIGLRECRRHPPVLGSEDQGVWPPENEGVWPKTDPSDWCGEYVEEPFDSKKKEG